MTRLLGNSLPLPYLRRSELINGSPAKAEIPRVQAGNTRFLREWVTGEFSSFDSTDKDPPCAPITGNCPHESAGLTTVPGPGHDHSGGVMGVPLVRNVWMTVYGDTDNGQTGGRALNTTLSSAGDNVDLCNTAISALWVPWSMSDGAYSSLWWAAYLHADVAANYAVELICAGDRIYEEGTLSTGYQRLTVGRALTTIPRRFNHVRCKINVTYAAAASVVHVLAWGLFQKKTTT